MKNDSAQAASDSNSDSDMEIEGGKSIFEGLMGFEKPPSPDSAERRLTEVRPAFEAKIKAAEELLPTILSEPAMELLNKASYEESCPSKTLFALLTGLSCLGFLDKITKLSAHTRTGPTSVLLKLVSFKGEDKSNIRRLFEDLSSIQLDARGKCHVDDAFTSHSIRELFNDKCPFECEMKKSKTPMKAPPTKRQRVAAKAATLDLNNGIAISFLFECVVFRINLWIKHANADLRILITPSISQSCPRTR